MSGCGCVGVGGGRAYLLELSWQRAATRGPLRLVRPARPTRETGRHPGNPSAPRDPLTGCEEQCARIVDSVWGGRESCLSTRAQLAAHGHARKYGQVGCGCALATLGSPEATQLAHLRSPHVLLTFAARSPHVLLTITPRKQSIFRILRWKKELEYLTLIPFFTSEFGKCFVSWG